MNNVECWLVWRRSNEPDMHAFRIDDLGDKKFIRKSFCFNFNNPLYNANFYNRTSDNDDFTEKVSQEQFEHLENSIYTIDPGTYAKVEVYPSGNYSIIEEGLMREAQLEFLKAFICGSL